LEPSDIAALFEHLALRLGAREPVAHNGGKWDPPGLETVTVDPHRSDYLGLHLDSWEGRSYAARKTARTRVCVNLGPQKRWFLFVGLSLPTIAEAIRAKRNDEFLLEPNELVHAFFREFPDFPVSRLAVDPGQAYFADTDNLIHDGSSFGAAGWTFHYTIRGHFDRLSRA
jgi:hypothetical protein